MQHEVDSGSRTTILVHYYRAMVGRADVWRTRMDTTTHWAIGATAAIMSFTLSNASVPHYVAGIATLMTLSFLLLEARRLTFYHLWQQRVLLLERGLVRPALWSGGRDAENVATGAGGGASDDAAHQLDLPAALDPHLGRTIPSMRLSKAVARRLRRVYLYIFGVQWLAWLLKLANHPTPISSVAALRERAALGVLPGEAVLALGTAFALVGILIAVMWGGVDQVDSRSSNSAAA